MSTRVEGVDVVEMETGHYVFWEDWESFSQVAHEFYARIESGHRHETMVVPFPKCLGPPFRRYQQDVTRQKSPRFLSLGVPSRSRPESTSICYPKVLLALERCPS